MNSNRAGRLATALGLGVLGLSACVSAGAPSAAFQTASRSGGMGYCATRNSVSIEEISRASPQKIEDLLEMIPGVEVSKLLEGFSVQIRGTNGFAGSGEPLYVIDGVQYNGIRGQMIPVPPQDVECIEVLKDASHTSLFGSRGANGVVLITTRRAH